MRRSAPLTLLALVMLLFSACAAEDPPEPPLGAETAETTALAAQPSADPAATATGGLTTITFGAYEYERARYEPVINAFHAEHPEIRVQFVALDGLQEAGDQPFNYDEWMRRTVSAADTLTSSGGGSELIERGYVRDLAPLILAEPGFNRDDYFPGLLPAEGQPVSVLPAITHIDLLAYNKDLWAARGLATPEAGWGWDEVLQAADKIAQQKGDEISVYGMLDWDGGSTVLQHELLGAGIDMYAPREEALRLDDPSVVAALERVESLFKTGVLYFPPRYPDGSFMHSTDYMPLIQGQRLGMWRAGAEQAGPGESLPFDIGFTTYPARLGSGPLVWSQGYMMSAGTQHPEAAWRWLSFLSKQELAAEEHGSPGSIPARRSVVESMNLWDRLGTEAAAAVQATLEQIATIEPQSVPLQLQSGGGRNMELFRMGIREALSHVVDEKQEAAAALREAQAGIEQAAQRTTPPTPTADPRPIVVATPVPEAPVASDATQITFGVSGFGMEGMRELAADFNRQNPDLFVTVKTVELQSGPQRITDIAAQSDCFGWWGAPAEEEADVVLDLQPLIDGDPNFPRDDYAPAVLAPFRVNGRLTGLPRSLSFQVLAYSKEAFADAGLEPPSAGWTLDDLISAAAQLTSGTGQNQRYGFLAADPAGLSFFLSQRGVDLLRGQGESTQPAYTDPQVVQALREYVEFTRQVAPNQPFTSYTSQSMSGERDQLIGAGKVGMWLSFNDAGFHGGGELPFTPMLAPLPLGSRGLSAQNFYADGLFISAQTAHAEACWRWLSHLSGQATQGESGFPARTSLLEAAEDQPGQTAGMAAVAQTYAEVLTSSSELRTVNWGDDKIDFFWLYRALDQILAGKDLEAQLAEAQELTEQYLECARGGQASGACARQVDPNYQGWRSADEP